MAANIFWGRTPLSMPPRGGSKNFQGDSPESFRDGIFAEGRRRADGGGSCGILQCTKIRCVGENRLDNRQILPKKSFFGDILTKRPMSAGEKIKNTFHNFQSAVWHSNYFISCLIDTKHWFF